MSNYDNIKNELLAYVLGMVAKRAIPVEKVEGGSYENVLEAQRKVHYSIARNSCVRTICEIGFNTGHSAMLEANPTAHVIT